MKKSLFVVTALLFSTVLHAETLDIRPIVKDRFEGKCDIRQNYDKIHNLQKYVVSKKTDPDRNAYEEKYVLKNIKYDTVPVKAIGFGYGDLGKQFNEILYLDVSKPEYKKYVQKLKSQSKGNNNLPDVIIRKNTAEVQCSWQDARYW